MINFQSLLQQIESKKERILSKRKTELENIQAVEGFLRRIDEKIIEDVYSKIPLKEEKNEILFCLPYYDTHQFITSYVCKIEEDYEIFAVDGSNTEIDRHISIPYYFINIATVYIDYHRNNNAFEFATYPYVYLEDEIYSEKENSFTIKNSSEISKERQMKEYQAILDYIQKSSTKEGLSLVLYDGNLIDWASDRQDIRFGRKPNDFLEDIFVQAAKKRIAVCGFISMPKNSIISNIYRIYNCSKMRINCKTCDEDVKLKCEMYQRIKDVFLFDHLENGECSDIFYTLGRAFDEFEESDITFIYINTGYEIARIEIPVYVAKSKDWVDGCIGAIYHQCKIGLGYPIVLTHAHDFCSISKSDKNIIEQLLFEKNNTFGRFSAKKQSKIKRIL